MWTVSSDYEIPYDWGDATAEMLLSSGEYADEQDVLSWTIDRNIKAVVITWNENWDKYKANNGYSMFRLNAWFWAKAIERTGICTHFEFYQIASWNINREWCTIWSNLLTFYIAISWEDMTLEDFKSRLADQKRNWTPVIFAYPLDTSWEETATPQPLDLKMGGNVIEVTESSLSGLWLSANYERMATNVINFVNNDGFITDDDIPEIVDNLTTQSATSTLSANQGYVLKWLIDNLMAQWRFLSLWNCATGMPISFPLATPYTYITWDYFMVEVVDSDTNYRPTGSSYNGTASSTAETWEVEVWDYYVYDWNIWLLASNHWKEVSFANITGQPSDNTNLNTALNGKQNNWIEVTVTTAYNTAAKVWTTTAWDYTPTQWDFLLVNFVNWCSINSPTLNIDWSGAKAIRTWNAAASTATFGLWNTANSNIKALLYYDWTYYRCWSTTNNNTTYSAMSVSEWQTGTATSSRSMRADYLKQIIKYHSVSNTAYDSTWDWVTDIAPSKNAVYDKIESLNIPTKTSDLTNDSWFITSSALPTKTSDLTNDSWFITSSDLTGYQTTSNMVTSLSNPDDNHYPTTLAVSSAISSAWWWDVTWPSSATNWHLAVFDWATGKIIKDWGAVPTVPTKVSDLTNDSWFITSSYHDSTKQDQHSTLSVTLTSAGWSSNTQTVTATGVTASNSVIVSPAPSSFSGYSSSAIYCSAQASNSLTFSCTTEPTSDITVNVLILN